MTSSSNKKDIAKLVEEYSISKLTQDGKTYLLRFNNSLWKIAGSSIYPFQVGIATTLKSNKDGFPTTEENAVLNKLEDSIIENFQFNNLSVFAGTITGGGIKEFVLYTGNPGGIQKKFDQFSARIKDYELQLNLQEDSAWEIFKAYCPKYIAA